jgi:hypothetical protein
MKKPTRCDALLATAAIGAVAATRAKAQPRWGVLRRRRQQLSVQSVAATDGRSGQTPRREPRTLDGGSSRPLSYAEPEAMKAR